MLLTRWLKLQNYMNDNVRKYAGYAVGEIALVIAGILIALQIDAWYEDRQIHKNLKTQLSGVAESISQDLAQVTRLKRRRTESIFESTLMTNLTGPESLAEQWYNAQYVGFASTLIAARQVPVYFVPATGAYDALEASGNASHIEIDRLKSDLHNYYATVERIVFAEREMNSLLREIVLKYQTETTQGLFKVFLQEPLIAWQYDEDNADDLRRFRQSYRRVLLDSVTQTMIRSDRNQPLLKEYEQLLSLGRLLLAQIESYVADGHIAGQPGEVFDGDAAIGPAMAIDDGAFEAHSLGLFMAPTGTRFGTEVGDLLLGHDHLRVNYRGTDDWVFVYLKPGPIEVSVQRTFLDYSRFDRIRLELKRHSGCDGLRLVLKDADDADDGSQADIKLDLAEDWVTYEYDLSRFSDADLERLNVVAGFLMDTTACSFSIRDVTFLHAGDD